MFKKSLTAAAAFVTMFTAFGSTVAVMSASIAPQAELTQTA